MKYFYFYLAVVNVIGFFLMRYDKEQSKRSRWRVSERRLFAYAAAGGALGVWAGMLAFRHKTKHWSFVLGVPALLVVNAACVYAVLTRVPIGTE
ncbi:DUF1294 domain-containing protein [Paenibacillus sp.]|uniref:DUF1294 domain-containing protein n=1 Tax=Paenibacillus sp. TaxID=58172 RepID=UPI002D2FCABC|nr:DUF1294 domain-containing protein [Paenibacillus sp.]HZG56452.1 DUF1294 domain-containing protein [Paenibacillus sp.]